MSDDEIDRRYPLSYDELVKILRKRYSDFKQDKKFNKLNEEFRKQEQNAYQRFLINKTKKGTCRWQYSSNILNYFDKNYEKI